MRYAIFCVCIILVSGCDPTWLPDSSGLIFGRKDGSVYFLDLATKKERQIAPTQNGQPIRAALSPDGKRVAIAACRHSAEKQTLQIFINDLNGKELHASAKFDMTPPKTKEEKNTSTLSYWSPDGKRLLVFVPATVAAVAYELDTKSFTEYRNARPISLSAAVNNIFLSDSPISPDSKGFLAARDDGESSVVYWRWPQANPDVMQLAPEVKESAPLEVDGNKIGFAPQGHWSEGSLFLRLHGDRLKIDPQAGKVTRDKDARTQELLQHAMKHKVLIAAELADKALVQITENREVQLWRPDREKPIRIHAFGKEDGVWIVPAPNKRSAALHVLPSNTTLIVFDTSGTVLATASAKDAK